MRMQVEQDAVKRHCEDAQNVRTQLAAATNGQQQADARATALQEVCISQYHKCHVARVRCAPVSLNRILLQELHDTLSMPPL